MKLIIRPLALLLCFSIAFACVAAAKDNGYAVVYDGGSLSGLKAGAKLKLHIDSDKITVMDGKEVIATLLPSTITDISYGQDVHRRIGTAVAVGVFTLGAGALVALSKSKKHFVGVTWAAGTQKAVSRCNVTRMIIAAFWLDWKESLGKKQWTPRR